MGVRLFDWRDLPALFRYRKDGVFLDSELLLTRGPLLLPGVLLSYLAPSMGIYTCVHVDSSGGTDSIGQFIHSGGNPLCHLTYISPDESAAGDQICTLLEFMMAISGERGALRLLADVDVDTSTFEALRRCGFAIFTRQRIWKISAENRATIAGYGWREASESDGIPVRTLYNNLVPGIVQQIEPFPAQRPHGMVCYQDGDLLAYIELKYGHRGVWAQPFFHPDAQDPAGMLVGFLEKLSAQSFRPIYLCVRSYHSWLEPVIDELGAEASPWQAVMVRQLAVQQKQARQYAIPNLDAGQTEMTAPLAHLENKLLYGTKENNR